MTSHSRDALILLSLMLCASACDRTSPPTPSPTSPSSTSTPDEPAPADDPWHGGSNTPIDEEDPLIQGGTFLFVTREKSAVCPTIAQAKARACGHSVESADTGYDLFKGERVRVVSRTPTQEGALPAIRYLVQGLTPGYIMAEDVAPTPDLSHRTARLAALAGEFPGLVTIGHTTLDARTFTAAAQPGAALLLRDLPVDETRFDNWQERNGGLNFTLLLADPDTPGSSQRVPLFYAIDMEQGAFPRFADEYGEVDNTYTCDESYCDTIDLVLRVTGEGKSELVEQLDRYGVWKPGATSIAGEELPPRPSEDE